MNEITKALAWLNASEERDEVWWEKAESLVPTTLDDPAEGVTWDELQSLSDEDPRLPGALAVKIETGLLALRPELPPEAQAELDQVIDDLDTRPGDFEKLLSAWQGRKEEEQC